MKFSTKVIIAVIVIIALLFTCNYVLPKLKQKVSEGLDNAFKPVTESLHQ